MSGPDLSELPVIGLGTWQNDDHEQCVKTVRNALEIGYRHIDTAQLYENEDAVGEALDRSTVDRDEIYLATKISFENLKHEDVLESTKESLNQLRTDYVDLLYVHWPAKKYDPDTTLTAFEKLQDQGYSRHLGLSNYTPNLLEEARGILGDNLYAHQVEMHPLLQQQHLRDDALKHDMKLVAYSPLRHGTIMELDEIRRLADKYDATPAQVAIAWLADKENVYPIPKATGRDHLEENFKAGDIDLADADVKTIDSIQLVDRYIDPPFAPDWEL